jgi:hypothetical protein
MELSGAESDTVYQPLSVTAFPILHARGDLGEENIALSKRRVTATNFVELARLPTEPLAGL